MMRQVDLRRIDLNLLVVLRALLDTRSVSRAAGTLGMSQPAVSRALARLRRQFGDRLLLKGGAAMTLTLFAESVAAPLSTLLSDTEAFLAGGPTFDPTTTERIFRLATTDYGAIAVLPAVLPMLKAAAPKAALEVLSFGRDLFGVLADGQVDLALYSDDPVPDSLRTADLFVESYASLVRLGHPAANDAVDGTIGLEAYLAHGHALVTVFGGRSGVIDDALALLGRRRRIAMWLPYFATAALLVARSDLILTLPRRAAEALAGPLGLLMLRPPVEPAPFGYRIVWHQRTHEDAGCQWFRALCLSSTAEWGR